MSDLFHKARELYRERKQKYLNELPLGGGYPGRQHGPPGPNVGIQYQSPPPVPLNKPIFRPVYQHQAQHDSQAVLFKALPTTCIANEDCDHIAISNVTFLGDVHSKTTMVKRDLGFQGQIGQYILLSYGDTMYSDSVYSDTWRGMTSNSIAFATHDPLAVVDTNLDENGYPSQFVPVNSSWGENMAEWAVGITNVIETTPGEGMLYYLLNHRPGPDHTDNLVGAGIARVSLDYSRYPPLPRADRLGRYLWDGENEPWYGDVGAVKANGYIYAYGHCKDSPFVYLSRVRVDDWHRVECYEYWHGKTQGWSHTRLLRSKIGEDESVFWQVNQGQVVWNQYLNRFVFIYCDNFWDKTVILRHARSPEGPWSSNIDVYKGNPISKDGNIYAAVPHPYFDPSGKTLVITFTNLPNCIQAIKVTFE